MNPFSSSTDQPTAQAPVEVLAYDISRPSKFELERVCLENVLAPWLAGGIEHIGSTAVPMLSAKPVIDIMAPVHALKASLPAIDAVAQTGYVYHPYKPEVMHWFCKPTPSDRTHHLHLVPIGSQLWRERLAIRDALRDSPKLAADCAVLNSRLALEFRFDREAYTEAKTPSVKFVLKKSCWPAFKVTPSLTYNRHVIDKSGDSALSDFHLAA
jgi:GrpB-like predicted nucleotidyltransferase (UPF0157 family)